jgi:hypothetical protein
MQMNFNQIPTHDELHGGKAKDMTLRDHYAGLAMQSLISGKDYINEPPKMIALDAYTLADAMLKAKAYK